MTSLGNPPPTLVPTRLGLHRLAAYVIAPARHAVTGRFGLRSTIGGFGTPEFDGRRIRVEAAELVDERGSDVRRTEISSLAAAAEFLDTAIDPDTAAEHDSPELGDTGADLAVDPAASSYLGEWFRVAFEALEIVRGDDNSVDASEAQLWPGHFDAAIEVGDESHRASYGASPGDHNVAEPYLYLAAWWPDRLSVDFDAPFWNGRGFAGVMMPVSELPAGRDPVEVAANFWLNARDRLHT